MKKTAVIGTMLLLIMLGVSIMQQAGIAAIAQEQPSTIDVRQMPFLDQMRTRLDEYNEEADWTLKVFPTDEPYLDVADETVYVEVYVSDVDDTTQLSEDLKTGKTENVFQVYKANERAVKQLAEIPHSYFYASKFSPSIGITIEKQMLQQIANIPSVYCIRIIQPLEPFLTWDQVRDLDDIAYTMANHDSTLDAATAIAVIDSGYDASDSLFYGWASDNIMPYTSWDFTDGNTDVSNGANMHGSSVADLLARGFGDSGDNDAMYENPNFWIPLKICDDSYSTAEQYAPQAIEWCIAHDVEIVCMSWGADPWYPWGINTCNGWWCDRFRTGTLGGTTWVAAAGNGAHTNGVAYPAESHFVVGIGAYDHNPAQRESYSNYGNTYFATLDPYAIYCLTCYNAQGFLEFKPNAYECGYFNYWGYGSGTSWAAPLACADIAIGMYSPTNGEYTQGYEYLLDVIALSNEFPVSPSESSQQGDVIDTHTLWHRSRVSP
ncbi:S8/S53 family peptidase [Candidatus Bathyarchaeota archaeon A05DMB-2]|jgi:phage gp46-like protein|nr:S8/S53 family peptidase [Candidatus Bathyarchaeota archaeon A05DMB-2]